MIKKCKNCFKKFVIINSGDAICSNKCKKERRLFFKRKNYRDNRKKILKQGRKYYKKNKEKRKIARKIFYENNKEYFINYRKKNADKIKLWRKKYVLTKKYKRCKEKSYNSKIKYRKTSKGYGKTKEDNILRFLFGKTSGVCLETKKLSALRHLSKRLLSRKIGKGEFLRKINFINKGVTYEAYT
ncbi:MAG: hypothetical protein WC269_06580 [Candidatus Gracilibacteria bacterium]